jgi:hypothetical protein
VAGAPLAGVRERLRRLAAVQRFEDAARLRDRLGALEAAIADLRELERLRALQVCLLLPALDDCFRTAVFVAGGRVASVRRLARNGGAAVEAAAGVAEALRSAASPSVAPEDADDLLCLAGFIRRPPPELRVLPFDAARIAAASAS